MSLNCCHVCIFQNPSAHNYSIVPMNHYHEKVYCEDFIFGVSILSLRSLQNTYVITSVSLRALVVFLGHCASKVE